MTRKVKITVKRTGDESIEEDSKEKMEDNIEKNGE